MPKLDRGTRSLSCNEPLEELGALVLLVWGCVVIARYKIMRGRPVAH